MNNHDGPATRRGRIRRPWRKPARQPRSFAESAERRQKCCRSPIIGYCVPPRCCERSIRSAQRVAIERAAARAVNCGRPIRGQGLEAGGDGGIRTLDTPLERITV